MEEIRELWNEILKKSRNQPEEPIAVEGGEPSDRLRDILAQYEKKSLVQMAKRQKMKGFSSLGKRELAARLGV